MAGKRTREAADEAAPQTTPKKLRFGPPKPTSVRDTPTKSALKKTTQQNGSQSQTPAATTPSNRASKKAAFFVTPTKQASKSAAATTPSTVTRHVDRSARKKATRALVERAVNGDLSEDEDADHLASRIYDGDEGDEESEENGEDAEELEDDPNALPTTEGGASASKSGARSETLSRRGRGRPKGSKNKSTPTPPPDLPAHEQYFFQNRPSAWKHASNTPNSIKLLAHEEYYAAMEKYSDPHASSIAALHELHEQSFPKWTFELREGYTVVLHGYGSKRRLLTGFCDYLHQQYPKDKPPTTIIVQAHHPAFSLRALMHAVAKAVGLEISSLPATVPAIWELISAQLQVSPRPKSKPIYLFISTLTARSMTTSAALTVLQDLASCTSIALVLTASNPSFPLLWPSNVRDTLNPILHDATTFLPYDSGTGPVPAGSKASEAAEASISALPIPAPPPGLSPLGASAPDAVAELLGRKATAFATRERVRWVLRSLPANARGLYQLLLEAALAAAEADADLDQGDPYDNNEHFGFDPFDADTDMNLAWAADFDDDQDQTAHRRRHGKDTSAADASGHASAALLPTVSSKTLYNAASAAFLCSSEMAFRGLLREFVDHAMLEVRRNEVAAEGGEMLGVPMARAEVLGVLEDLRAEG